MAQPKIHPSAFVSSKAELDEDVVIGPCAVIEDYVTIGKGTRIDAFASVFSYTTLGENNRVFSYAAVGNVPQDLKFHGEVTKLVIGNRNNIREFSTIHRGTEDGGGITSIGDNNLIMAYVHIAHDCHVGNNIVMSNNATLAGHCTVEDNAIIGGLTAAHQFVRIGKNSFAGGMTAIKEDLPPYMLAFGNPAVVLSPNLVGLRRLGAGLDLVQAFKQAYRLTWHSGLPRAEALAQLESEHGHRPEIAEYIAFIKGSKRGILSGKDRKSEND